MIYRARMMKETDKRVHTISEMLTNIKFIKMYAWEDCFERKVTGRSNMEQDSSRLCVVAWLLRSV